VCSNTAGSAYFNNIPNVKNFVFKFDYYNFSILIVGVHSND